MNKLRWSLDLSCGHEVFVTAKTSWPIRKHEVCPKCTFVEPAAPAPMARAKWTDPDYRRDPKTDRYCCICQRDLAPGKPFRLVHWLGCGWVLHPDDEAPLAAGALMVDDTGTPFSRQEDFGEQKIGMECARRLGLEWSREPVKIG